jgi:hypothetical protein
MEMPTDFVTDAAAAVTTLYDAGRGINTILLDQALEGQTRVNQLTGTVISELNTAGREGAKVFERVAKELKRAQGAGEELVKSYVAASIASWYLPFAFVGQPAKSSPA